jgi:glycosyltransferase involved in cell wall biosynthesis
MSAPEPNVLVRVGFAHLCSGEPMGQELADEGLLAELLRDPYPHHVGDLGVTGMHDQSTTASRRLPLTKVQSMPWGPQRTIGSWLYREYDLVHRLDLRLPPAAAPEILTIRDLAPLRFPDEGALPRWTARSVNRAAAIVSPSRFSADELRREFGRDEVYVIRDGLDSAFLDARPLSAAECARFALPARWVLHTGGASIRKNLDGLAAAWPRVVARYPDVELVMCGPTDPRRNALFERLPAVRLMGKVDRALLVQLMASAAAVVVPSLYEGYGLPVQEAMAAGVPVVAAAAASLPEVAGTGAILVENSPEALADGICRALKGVAPEVLRQAQLEARGRSWAASARAYKDVYSAVAESRLRTDRGRRTPWRSKRASH